MVDLTSEMASLWASLGPAPLDRGRVIQFVAASEGEGVSTVAREFARLAAVRARKPIWLVDADLDNQTQMSAILADAARFGGLGTLAGASPDGSSFFTVQPPSRTSDNVAVPDSAMVAARPALGGRLWVTRLRIERLRQGQRARMLPVAAYWDALRRHADYVVVDSPALDRSDAAATLAPFMDATILVLAAESTEASEAAAVRDAIERAGGRVAGLVLNRVRVETPPLVRRFLPS
jgi:Mrp family chromosome partitioning ATPase